MKVGDDRSEGDSPSREPLSQRLESVGLLAAGIAHEINTPIQYVGDNTRFAEESFRALLVLLGQYQKLADAVRQGEPTDEVIKAVEEAEQDADLEFLVEEVPPAIKESLEGIERVTGIVAAMREFAHPGMDETVEVDVNRCVNSAATLSRNEWKYASDLTLDLDPVSPRVLCRKGELHQVVLNLMVNASHAVTEAVERGLRERGEIRITTRINGDVVELSISDTGTGIPESIRDQIFESFFTTKEVGKGTGQGLAIARRLVEEMDGGIELRSEVGVGTTFVLRLPGVPADLSSELVAGVFEE